MGPTLATGGTAQEVLLDGESREDHPPLGNLGDAQLHGPADPVRVDDGTVVLDRAFADCSAVHEQKAGDSPHESGLPGTVGTQDRNELAGGDTERNPRQRSHGVVVDHVEPVDDLESLRGHVVKGHFAA